MFGSAAIGAAIAMAGLITELGKREMLRNDMSACWAPNVTASLNDLATKQAVPALKASYPDDLSKESQDEITGSFKAEISNYGFLGETNDWGTINCEGSIRFSYTRPDGSLYQKNEGNIVSYTVHHFYLGYDSEMSQADVSGGIVAYVPPPIAK